MTRKIEQIYVKIPGFDITPEPIEDFVAFVEGLAAQPEPFVVYAIASETMDEQRYLGELRHLKPIIAKGDRETFPFISDPDEQFPGAVAIYEGQLVYSPTAITLHNRRDKIEYSTGPFQYFLNATAAEVVETLVDRGYPLRQSPDLKNFKRAMPFTINGEIPLEDLTKK